MNSFKKLRTLLLSISLSTIHILPNKPSFAQAPPVPQPSTAPLQLSLLKPPGQSNNGTVKNPSIGNCDNLTVVTANTICQQQLTIPSLWWAQEQFGGELVDNWLAYPARGTAAARVDLVVNQQIWSILDYVQRYEFVNKFGSVARDYGYNTRVFNYQEELLGTYTCDFSRTPNQCSLQLDARGLASVRGF